MQPKLNFNHGPEKGRQSVFMELVSNRIYESKYSLHVIEQNVDPQLLSEATELVARIASGQQVQAEEAEHRPEAAVVAGSAVMESAVDGATILDAAENPDAEAPYLQEIAEPEDAQEPMESVSGSDYYDLAA